MAILAKKTLLDLVIECRVCRGDSVYPLADGSGVKCQDCGYVWDGAWRLPGHRIKHRLGYWLEHPELRYNREYYLTHKEGNREGCRIYRLRHSEAVSSYMRRYRENHREKMASIQRAYYSRHKVVVVEAGR